VGLGCWRRNKRRANNLHKGHESYYFPDWGHNGRWWGTLNQFQVLNPHLKSLGYRHRLERGQPHDWSDGGEPCDHAERSLRGRNSHPEQPQRELYHYSG